MERDLSQEAAERLLSGDLSSPPEGTQRLAALLAAASAPGHPDELAGEAAAMAAFRAHPPTVRRWSLRRVLTVKVATAVVAATVAVGGVAVASGTGLLPIPFIPGMTGPDPSGTDGPTGRSSGQGRTAGPTQSPPHEAWPALCADLQKKTPGERPKELKGKRFEELVRAAGAPERVEEFCGRVLAATPAPGKGRDGATQGNTSQGNPSPGNGNQGVQPSIAPHPNSVPSRPNTRG